MKQNHSEEVSSLKNKHKAELDYETTALKKDKEDTVKS
jgi:hypothetical protein